MSLEDDFHKAMLRVYEEAGQEVGYWANYFLRDVRKNGGLKCAKRMLQQKNNGQIQKGLQALIDAGRADISVEAIVLKPQFSALFTELEILEARNRLEGLPTINNRITVPAAEIYPDEIQESSNFNEGSLKTVTINLYERNAKARVKCLEKHGYNCSVCGINFEKIYGEIGKKFIHVHHKKPLALIRKNYELDPIKDLAPVCPNCHAMLHTTNPPLSIPELKKILVEQRLKK